MQKVCMQFPNPRPNATYWPYLSLSLKWLKKPALCSSSGMSNCPDRILSLGGFRTSRDSRNKNTRLDCPWCPKKGMLFTSYGIHIIKEHLEDVFHESSNEGKYNRKELSRRKALEAPLPMIDPRGDQDNYWCLGCQSCFRCATKAEQHMKSRAKCLEIHRENILKYRNDYPLTDTPKASPLRYRANLENLIDNLLYRVRELEHKLKVPKEEAFDYKRDENYFDVWGLDIKEETLKESWPSFDPKVEAKAEVQEESPESPKAPPSPPPEDDDILPLVVEKPISKEEQLMNLLKDPNIDEASKAMLRKQLNLTPAPAPPPPPPAPVSEDFTKLTPWQRILKANEGMNIQELLRYAQSMGIQPDEGGMKIVCNTKAKRAPKAC